jgi:hypothetical protein
MATAWSTAGRCSAARPAGSKPKGAPTSLSCGLRITIDDTTLVGTFIAPGDPIEHVPGCWYVEIEEGAATLGDFLADLTADQDA